MKTVLKSGIFFVLISLLTWNVAAQDKVKDKKEINSKELAVKQTQRMAKELELNADQQTKVKAIHEKYNDQMKAKAQKTKETRNADKEARMSMHKAKAAEMKEVLTPEQYEKWQVKQQERKKDAQNKKWKKGERKSEKKESRKENKKQKS